MSRPPLFPQQSAAGIAVDPGTLERVIPESKRPDGSVRKQIKIRPGFTPQEDVSRFRGTRQQAMDAAAIPKGHILGWVAPSETQQKAKGAGAPPPNKNAKKRANQRAKKAAEKAEEVKDNWEDEEDGEKSATGEQASTEEAKEAADKPSAVPESTQGEAEVTEQLSKLKLK
ncbi:hypothetical protein JVU11DRAFT_1747 [Chiua virens]|nr:hypothetical protein JVU11DRAFT_1747 [Chiua virens]